MPEAYQRYEIGAPIASGGMGEVLASRDVELNRTVALKRMLLTPDEADGQNAVKYFERFLEEAQITAQLDHPSIVPIHDLGFDEEGRAFYTMRLVQGRELGAIFHLARERKEGWNLARVIGVLVKVCQAVAYAHGKGVVHRDLKPSNIMVGELGEVYVMDWGLAKAVEGLSRDVVRTQLGDELSGLETIAVARSGLTAGGSDPTQYGTIVGTPAYMAPEQARGDAEGPEPAGDIYALGAILYELLTGHPPYMGQGESTTAEDVIHTLRTKAPADISMLGREAPVELQAICAQAMARDKNERYPTSLEYAEDLQAYLDGRVVSAHASGHLARLKKWIGRNRVLAAALLLTFLAILSVAVISTRASLQLARALQRTEEEQERTLEALAESFFLQGIQHHEQGNVRLALAHWGKALDHDPAHAPTAARVAAALLQDIIPLPAEKAIESGDLVQSLTVDPKGRFIAVLSHDNAVRIWDRQAQQWTHRWQLPNAWAGVFAFHPDGELLVVIRASRDWQQTQIHWLDVVTGQERWPVTAFPGQIGSLSFSEDGQLMACLGRVWSMESGKMIHIVDDPDVTSRPSFRTATQISADGHRLVVGTISGRVLVYAMEGFRLVSQHQVSNKPIGHLRWSQDASRYACAVQGYTASVHATSDHAAVGPPLKHPERVADLAFNRRGDKVLTGCVDGSLRLWNAEKGSLHLPVMHHGASIYSARFSPDESMLFTLGADSTVKLWHADSGKLVCEPWLMTTRATQIGDQLIAADTEGRITVWDIPGASAQPLRGEFKPNRFGRSTMVLTANGRWIISAQPEGGLLGIDSQTGKSIFETTPSRSHRAVAAHPDSTLFAAARENGSIVLHGLPNGEELTVLPQDVGVVTSLVFSASGDQLAAACETGEIFIWRLSGPEAEGPPRVIQTLSFDDVTKLAFGPLGRRLSASKWGNQDFAWDLSTGEVVGRWPHEAVGVTPHFMPKGELIALGGVNRFTRWDSTTGRMDPEFQIRHLHTIVGSDFSDDGKYVATASHDTTARVWSLATGAPEGDPLKHADIVLDVQLNADASRALTAAKDEHVHLWDRTRSVPLAAPYPAELPSDTQLIGAQFTRDEQRVLAFGLDAFSLWDLPPTNTTPIPEWLGDFAETVGGLRVQRILNTDGHAQIVTETTPWDERFALWGKLTSSTTKGRHLTIVQWFLDDEAQRGPSPAQQPE